MTRRSSLRPVLLHLEAREVPARIGGFDPSFGVGGLATTDFGYDDRAQAIVIQADGRIVVAGFDDGGSADFALARYNPDGTLDTTFNDLPSPTAFNGDGRLSFTFGAGEFGGVEKAYALAIDSVGRIVVAGFTDAGGSNDFAVGRVNPNGTLDPSFDGDGKLTIDFGFDDRATGVALRADDSIVVVGSSDGGFSDFAIARLKANGSLDPTFDADGKRSVSLGGADFANAVAIQSDGAIVVAGYSDADGGTGANDFALLRLNADGSDDATFDGDGRKFIDFGFDDRATALAIQSDGKIVVAGFIDGGSSDFALARLNPDGSLDTTFNDLEAPTISDGDGRLSFSLGGVDKAYAVALDDRERILVAGTTAATGGGDAALARIDSAGFLDPTFNATGMATFDSGSDTLDEARGVAVQANDQIVLAGFSFLDPDNDFALMRVNATVGVGEDLLVGGSPNGRGVEYLLQSSGLYATPGTPIDLLTGLGTSVRVAEADVNGDGVLDRIAVAGPGATSRLTVHNGIDNSVMVAPFNVFEDTFTGGLFVAAGDLNGDGRAEIVVTPDLSGGPVAAIYDGASLAAELTRDAAQIVRFFGINDPAFRGGARPALGDVNGDGTPDLIISAGFGGGPRIAIYKGDQIVANAASLAASGVAGAPFQLTTDFFAFESSVRNGVFVAAGDINGDGFDDLVFGGGPTAGPRVRVVSGRQLLTVAPLSTIDDAAAETPGLQIGNFFAGDPASRGGVPVAVKDADGDATADVIAASGEGLTSRVLVYRSATVTGVATTPPADQIIDPFSQKLAGGVYVG